MSTASITEAIEAIANGEFVVVVDDEDRENEGDLIIAGEAMTAEKMGFHGPPHQRSGVSGSRGQPSR